MLFIGRHKLYLNKLKIGIGVCSAALGLIAVGSANTVHADAINWNENNQVNQQANTLDNRNYVKSTSTIISNNTRIQQHGNVKTSNVHSSNIQHDTNVDIKFKQSLGSDGDYASVRYQYVDLNGNFLKDANNINSYSSQRIYEPNSGGSVTAKYPVPKGYQLRNNNGTYIFSTDVDNHNGQLVVDLPDRDQVNADYGTNVDGTEFFKEPSQADYDNAKNALTRIINQINQQDQQSEDGKSNGAISYFLGAHDNDSDSFHVYLQRMVSDHSRFLLCTQSGFIGGLGSITHGTNFTLSDHKPADYNEQASWGWTYVVDSNDLKTIGDFMDKYCDNGRGHIDDSTMVIGANSATSQGHFVDNSGNAYVSQTNIGNGEATVNVILVKPQSVNDVSLTTLDVKRTITLHFPNNQMPEAYKQLVSINNNKDQIVQTLTFNRNVTKDGITGEIINESAWQGNSKFPDIKLPKIPGFKLQIS